MCTQRRSRAPFPRSTSQRASRSRPERLWSRSNRARSRSNPIPNVIPEIAADPLASPGNEQLGRPPGTSVEEAGNLMLPPDVDELRRFDLAALHRVMAAGVEGASGRRIDGTRHVAVDHGPQSLLLGIGYRNGS